MEAIYFVCQLFEKIMEENHSVYLCFVSLERVYDIVLCGGLS